MTNFTEEFDVLTVQRGISFFAAAFLIAGLVCLGSGGLREITPGEADGLVGGDGCGTFEKTQCLVVGRISGSLTQMCPFNGAFRATASGLNAEGTGSEFCGITSSCSSSVMTQGLMNPGCGN